MPIFRDLYNYICYYNIMKKSKDITKYNIKWQLLRLSLKGPSISMPNKIKYANRYFDSEKTIDAYERVLNYLEGLQMGYRYRNPDAANRIQQEIDRYCSMDTQSLLKEPNGFITFEDASEYSYTDRHNLWVDLFIRNKKWLERGYFQKEINDFMDVLYKLFTHRKETSTMFYSYEKLKQLRNEAKRKTNTHKFFF